MYHKLTVQQARQCPLFTPWEPWVTGIAVGNEAAPKPRLKVNPFGNAKPRETRDNEERVLKEEINLLKVALKETEGNNNDELQKVYLRRYLRSKGIYTFFQISPQLDEKIWFGQRPDSGAGRVTAPRLNN
ncbi:hypothetical protein QYE76_023428 [Lolium multiflorum]|uniref:Uncharacterized protein n=1 Tax=Lolium multiflorum TaxID=4521 RepID=A0AAD8RBP7_LOLMU|nr:hypothetical protein QYE76_023428 [Lolium multiflorum]